MMLLKSVAPTGTPCIYKFKIECKKFEYLLSTRINAYNKKTIIPMLEHKIINFLKIYQNNLSKFTNLVVLPLKRWHDPINSSSNYPTPSYWKKIGHNMKISSSTHSMFIILSTWSSETLIFTVFKTIYQTQICQRGGQRDQGPPPHPNFVRRPTVQQVHYLYVSCND